MFDVLGILPSDSSYTTFCNLVTGYRVMNVIMQAVESGLIDVVGEQGCPIDELPGATGMKEEEGRRFVSLLVNIGFLERYGDHLYLSLFARKFLLKDSELSQRSVLEFEKVLIGTWNRLGAVLRDGQGSLVTDLPPGEWENRRGIFQKAMGEAARIRANELWGAIAFLPETGLIIDVGAGDGTYLKEFLKRYPYWRAVACDLPEVFTDHGSDSREACMSKRPCNILDPKERDELVSRHKGAVSMLLLSNFIHCYSEPENIAIISQLRDLLKEDGLLVIHDFFRDGNSFGALYDIHMMVNTYNGRTFTFDETICILQEAGFLHNSVIELPSYSHGIVARRNAPDGATGDSLFLLRRLARSLGFFAAAGVDPGLIRIEPWVKAKCRYGCMFYGRKWSCPPHSLESDEFRELVGSYSKAMIVAGQPPLRDFQGKLLELEKKAFLMGFKKALVFTGGPCSWCESCDDTRCRFPEKRRPSLESCGCDVFALAETCGIPVAPIKTSDDFIQYIGLLLVE